MCACVRARVRACVYACVRANGRVGVCVRVRTCESRCVPLPVAVRVRVRVGRFWVVPNGNSQVVVPERWNLARGGVLQQNFLLGRGTRSGQVQLWKHTKCA